MCVSVHVCACPCVCGVREAGRRGKNSAGENRQVVSDGEIGTGIKSDRERESIQGTDSKRDREAKRDRASEGREIGLARREPQKPSDRQPRTGGKLNNRVKVSDEEGDKDRVTGRGEREGSATQTEREGDRQ